MENIGGIQAAHQGLFLDGMAICVHTPDIPASELCRHLCLAFATRLLYRALPLFVKPVSASLQKQNRLRLGHSFLEGSGQLRDLDTVMGKAQYFGKTSTNQPLRDII